MEGGYRKYHPVYLDLRNRRVLIVGGGPIAIEKLESLMPSGALLTILSPEIDPRIRSWAEEGKLKWTEKRFEATDVEGFFMVIAATNDPETNAWVFRTGNERDMLSNSVDDPDNCNFIMAAILAEGPMQVAVSSAGCSPALAQRIRAKIREEILTPEVGELGAFLGSWRYKLKKEIPGYRERQGFWERVIDSDLPEILARDGREAADRRLIALMAWGSENLACLRCRVGARANECLCKPQTEAA